MKRIAVLGSTGSIGTNTLKVLSRLKDRYEIAGLAAGANTALLAAQSREWKPDWVYAAAEEKLRTESLPPGTRILRSAEELAETVCQNVDMVLCAIVGTGGLRPVLNAVQAGIDIALASKEILVMAGNLVTEAAAKSGAKLLPVDSEHCAIFQCLDGHPGKDVSRIILTCSGGPFRNRKDLDLSKVTLEQTLKHPTWSMGRKITIDSATLMNKGLEMIEAGWLFNVPESQVEVTIHPQSIIHSMVEFKDSSILAQMGYPDMCLPIHYCLCYPERTQGVAKPMDFTLPLEMTFEAPDTQRFPALDIARNAMRTGNAAGAIFNAANEIAVDAFISGKLSFDRIPGTAEYALEKLGSLPAASLEDILYADRAARNCAADFIN